MTGNGKIRWVWGIPVTTVLAISFLLSISRIGPAKRLNSRYTQLRTRNINTYLRQNEEKVLDSCLSADDGVLYYRDVYSVLINTIYNLERRGFLRKRERVMLFSILKNGNISDLREKIDLTNLVRLDSHSLSKRHLMMALASDINFDNFSRTEDFYKKAVESDRFDLQNYLLLARFYHKSCRYDAAIDTLLTVSSIANNSSQRINLSDNYKMLADLYMAKRDYENALANYANSLVTLDFKDRDKDKTRVLISLGDIMMIRGNNLEAINYYKYALSIGKLKPKLYLGLLLKLSNAYYTYGNYGNGLKFATMAANRAKKLGNRLFYSKSKYSECLNYEYLGEQKKAASACLVAINEGERYREESSDYQAYLSLAEMLDFSRHSRNPELAVRYLETARDLIKNSQDVYRKIEILERLASVKSHSIGINGWLPGDVVGIYNNLYKIYGENDIGIGCCNSLISGFMMERSGLRGVENMYLQAERELKNRKRQLATLYTYMSDFYEHSGNGQKALFYAKKALEIDSQIYKFDHHYIKYSLDKLTQLTGERENR
ncbi:MAG: hypothetical protein LBI29_03240 [Rickettsiales bacterium]|jgi:tetratricopeptide (TPR) repeat protein|nr:hypothetical protein [Rickettsiales bacterium]